MATRTRLVVSAAVLLALRAAPAFAFALEGHEVIEAAAYKRLLGMRAVPGTGTPGVSGRTLLATLIAAGVLAEPPCFDPAHPHGDCGPGQRLDLPIDHWPTLRSGGPDLVLDRQLGQRGQCQHFMARTDDGLAPNDPRFGVPRDLITVAYGRCIQLAALELDGIVRDPSLAEWRGTGTYSLMHALQDSFSAAHVERDDRGAIVHLLSWSLIDWPRYLGHGRWSFPKSTHHAVTDARDHDYIRWDQRAKDGHSCREFRHPYAVPAECLTDRASAAADAVTEYLILLYQLRTSTSAGAPGVLAAGSESAKLWLEFANTHLASVTEKIEVPATPYSSLRRPDLFVGAQASGGGSGSSFGWGAGLWASRLFIGPAVPFVLGPSLAVGYTRQERHDGVTATAGLGLLLPLVRRFTVGATPLALAVGCDTRFTECTADAVARLGLLLVPVGRASWVGVEGPVWSWSERSIGSTWVGLAFGWSQERRPDLSALSPQAVPSWNPPRPDEVRSYRRASATRLVYLAATAASRPENQFVGAGLDMRFDRDRWNHRAGFGPGLEVEVDAGNIDSPLRGGLVAVAPTACWYVMRDLLSVVATPALVRSGALGGQAFAVDVAARAGLSLAVGRLEFGVDSPPLSYVTRSRWHALPITGRLGFSFE